MLSQWITCRSIQPHSGVVWWVCNKPAASGWSTGGHASLWEAENCKRMGGGWSVYSTRRLSSYIMYIGHTTLLIVGYFCCLQFLPPVIGRAPCGFVGLKNAGATCYMNAVLQQLYMEPTIRDVMLFWLDTINDNIIFISDYSKCWTGWRR